MIRFNIVYIIIWKTKTSLIIYIYIYISTRNWSNLLIKIKFYSKLSFFSSAKSSAPWERIALFNATSKLLECITLLKATCVLRLMDKGITVQNDRRNRDRRAESRQEDVHLFLRLSSKCTTIHHYTLYFYILSSAF